MSAVVALLILLCSRQVDRSMCRVVAGSYFLAFFLPRSVFCSRSSLFRSAIGQSCQSCVSSAVVREQATFIWFLNEFQWAEKCENVKIFFRWLFVALENGACDGQTLVVSQLSPSRLLCTQIEKWFDERQFGRGASRRPSSSRTDQSPKPKGGHRAAADWCTSSQHLNKPIRSYF